MLSLLFPAVLFGLVYFPTLKYLSVAVVTPYAKVDVKKRLLAAWVDGMPAIAAWFLYRNTESLWGVAVAVLESITMIRDPQGQRLGDRLAQTQVIEGLGAKDLATSFREWWMSVFGNLERDPRRRRRQPADSRRNQESGIRPVDLPVRRSSSR